jgi:hypothetical protein
MEQPSFLLKTIHTITNSENYRRKEYWSGVLEKRIEFREMDAADFLEHNRIGL